MASTSPMNDEETMRETLTIPKPIRDALEPYLPSQEHHVVNAPVAIRSEGNSGDKDDNDNRISTTDITDDTSSQNADAHPPSNFPSKPYVTLTYASSLDSTIAASPNTRTALSGPQSKAMTHFLRSRHDAILIGVGTAIADNPGLNCRFDADDNKNNDNNIDGHCDIAQPRKSPHPRPVIIDPSARFSLTRESKLYKLAKDGLGKGPWVFCGSGPVSKEMMDVLAECGGEYVFHALDGTDEKGEEESGEGKKAGKKRTGWEAILARLGERGIKSVMVEGGGRVINGLLEEEMRRLMADFESREKSNDDEKTEQLVDAVVQTIAPLYLGIGGVVTCPERPAAATPSSIPMGVKNCEEDFEGKGGKEENHHRQQQFGTETQSNWQGLRLKRVKWIPMGEDVVMCGLLT